MNPHRSEQGRTVTMDALDKLHDANLVAIHFDPMARTCVLEVMGGPSLPGPFELRFDGVTGLRASSAHAWGRSNAILEARVEEGGEVVFEMQSGDVVTVWSAT